MHVAGRTGHDDPIVHGNKKKQKKTASGPSK